MGFRTPGMVAKCQVLPQCAFSIAPCCLILIAVHKIELTDFLKLVPNNKEHMILSRAYFHSNLYVLRSYSFFSYK
jgi:hypothetical protein